MTQERGGIQFSMLDVLYSFYNFIKALEHVLPIILIIRGGGQSRTVVQFCFFSYERAQIIRNMLIAKNIVLFSFFISSCRPFYN
jgi:hypothetical protein